MASLVSAEASAHGHLHLDPTLEVAPEIDAECKTCCPIKAISRKLFCCCASNCCNTTVQRPSHDVVVYVCKDGLCEPFDPTKSTDHAADYRKTAERVISLTGSNGMLIRQNTGVNIDYKVTASQPLTARELDKIRKM